MGTAVQRSDGAYSCRFFRRNVKWVDKGRDRRYRASDPPAASAHGGVRRRAPTPPAGFEPATCGLEVRCSIQLSYGGLAGPRRSCQVGAARTTAPNLVYHWGQPPFPIGDPTVPPAFTGPERRSPVGERLRDGCGIARLRIASSPSPSAAKTPDDVSHCGERTALASVSDQEVTHRSGCRVRTPKGRLPGGEPAPCLLAIHPPSRWNQSVTPATVFINSAAAALGLP